jgi:hypothetical protein
VWPGTKCYNNHVCVNCVYGIISATIDKLILSAIIVFQYDKINYETWQCPVVVKQFPSRIYKTECFETPRNQRSHLIDVSNIYIYIYI